MDAVKFLEERNRMCKSYGSCFTCPAHIDYTSCKFGVISGGEAIEQIKLVEKWSAAHPLRTRQSVFLEHYPNADLYEDGVLKVCPNVVEGSSYENTRNCGRIPCEVCRKNYWMKAVE